MLRRARGEYANLQNCDEIGQSFRGDDLSWANMTNAELQNADFTYADLAFANLTEADLDGAIVAGATLTFNTFSNTICPNGAKTIPGGSCWPGDG